jgi:hypothetical protein
MSFLLDPPLLVASGAAAEAALGDEPSAVRAARAAAVGSFVAVSLALYANFEPLVRIWPTLGARSGREFMLTSGLAPIDERRITARRHAAALSLFALYPLWFELGRALTRRH